MAREAERLSHRPFGARIADELRRDILLGRIGPEDRLTQDSICERFGTSRIPVRDAFQILVHQGFLQPSGAGVKAVPLSRRDLEDMFHIEGSLHALATRFATSRASASAIDELNCINDEMDRARQCGDYETAADANYRFHRRINELADSPRLLVALRATSAKIHGRFLLVFQEESEAFVAEHRVIIAAMQVGNESVAADLMFSHVLGAVEPLRRAGASADPIGDILEVALESNTTDAQASVDDASVE